MGQEAVQEESVLTSAAELNWEDELSRSVPEAWGLSGQDSKRNKTQAENRRSTDAEGWWSDGELDEELVRQVRDEEEALPPGSVSNTYGRNGPRWNADLSRSMDASSLRLSLQDDLPLAPDAVPEWGELGEPSPVLMQENLQTAEWGEWGDLPGQAPGMATQHVISWNLEEAARARQELEAFLYRWAVQMAEVAHFMSEKERALILQLMQHTETWLKNDGINVKPLVYKEKLSHLQKICGIVEERKQESDSRIAALEELRAEETALRSALEAASVQDAGAEGLEAARRILEEDLAELEEQLRQQEQRKRYEDCVVQPSTIRKCSAKMQQASKKLSGSEAGAQAGRGREEAANESTTEAAGMDSPESGVPSLSVPADDVAGSAQAPDSPDPKKAAQEEAAAKASQETGEHSKPAEEKKSGGGCFPGMATVMVPGGTRRIDQLELGDRVAVVPDKSGDGYGLAVEKVLLFAARDPDDVLRDYVQICTTSGSSVMLSPGHLLPCMAFRGSDGTPDPGAAPASISSAASDSSCHAHELHRAEDVRPGWHVWVLHSSRMCTVRTTVQRVTRCKAAGRFAPLTGSCNTTLIVDGVVVSQLTDFVDGIVSRGRTHELLSPLRTLYHALPSSVYAVCAAIIPYSHDTIVAARNALLTIIGSKSIMCTPTKNE
ncbi:hypothetical protein CYMTET_50767 [Cymbomonas tetramitiformis]|uniref:Hint domain-containing protein n=1 Tax=Cymbomonas tetramitiformis TaxID=36881 RepID=A0AAE0BMD3_9CHLO|nr:hypothetical protein CYMTET_50767 [Cymbomonas tetramitiformis]